MSVYLEDDLDSGAFVGLIEKFGHEVVSPTTVATQGFRGFLISADIAGEIVQDMAEHSRSRIMEAP